MERSRPGAGLASCPERQAPGAGGNSEADQDAAPPGRHSRLQAPDYRWLPFFMGQLWSPSWRHLGEHPESPAVKPSRSPAGRPSGWPIWLLVLASISAGGGGLVGLGGCSSAKPTEPTTLELSRAGAPLANAAVSVSPLDRRNLPVNPVELSPLVEYLTRPRPEPSMFFRTPSTGRVRMPMTTGLVNRLEVLAPGGAGAIFLIEPIDDEEGRDGWHIVPLDDGAGPGKPPIQLRLIDNPGR